MQTVVDRLINKGKREGRKEGVIETAKNFLENGVSIEIISKCTGLTIEEVKKLK